MTSSSPRPASASKTTPRRPHEADDDEVRGPHDRARHTRVTRAVLALARRALRNVLRRPQFIAPLVVFPSLMLAANVGGLSRTTSLPGFPTDVHGFLDFQLAAAITQSLLLGGVSAGIAVALEIEGGFFDRLLAAPIPRIAIVLGRLAATTVIAVVQVAYFLVLGLIFGAHIRAGIPGAVLVALIGALAGTGFGALGVMLALRAKSASTVQGIFPLVFVVLFVSSAFFPRQLLESPARQIARYNPLSYLADGMRDPIIHTLRAAPILEGLAAAAGITVVAVTLSVLALRGRLGQT
jgi:ABC-2 type transport system permease protein